MKDTEDIIETRKGNVYLRRQLKEVELLLDPHLNFLQIVWTNNKTDIENWMTTLKTTW